MTEEEKLNLYKEIFKKFNYGLYVLGGANSDAKDLIICSWVMQSSYDQGDIIINIDQDRPVYSMIKESGKFTVSILGIENLNEASVCALSRDERKKRLGTLDIGSTLDAIPYLKNSLGYLECDYSDSIKLKAALLLIGTPTGGEVLSEGKSLTLHDYYKSLE